MTRIRRWGVAALVVAAGLVSARTAAAGPLLDYLCHHDCPRPSYSPCRYWTPTLARGYDCVHGPRLSSYPPNTDTPPTYTTLKFRCQPADPAATLIQPPSR
jgi:hypothetical protein